MDETDASDEGVHVANDGPLTLQVSGDVAEHLRGALVEVEDRKRPEE